MLLKTLFLFIVSIAANADTQLLREYYITSNEVNVSTIIPNIENDAVLYELSDVNYIKKVKTGYLMERLKEQGYILDNVPYRYITFIKKSPIDTTKMKDFLKRFYKKKYEEINITNIKIMPRIYVKSLPEHYTIKIRHKNYLSNEGTFSIKTPDKKKIFFDYTITAILPVLKAKNHIKRGEELSVLNCKVENKIFDSFKDTPLQSIESATLEARHTIKQERIITQRDTEQLSLVKRNDIVNVTLHSSNIDISFSAKALEDGKLHETIEIQKSDGNKIEAIVIGRGKVQIK